jgi:hypothetical protein
MTKEKESITVPIGEEALVDTAVMETPVREVTPPPEALKFESLCDLYQQYLERLVSHDHKCPRGVKVVFEDYHFFHLVKLSKGFQTAFKMASEKETILACKDGFGGYKIDANRAAQLSWIAELIGSPHEIYEYEQKKTADEVFIREYDKSGSPFKVFLVKRQGDILLPVTSMTVKRPAIKEHRKGKKLWPQ